MDGSSKPEGWCEVQAYDGLAPNEYMLGRLRAHSSDIRAALVWPKGLAAKKWPTPRGNGAPYLALVIDRRYDADPPMTDADVVECAMASFWERHCGDWSPEIELVALDKVISKRANERISERVSAMEQGS